jgi:FG-GAP repeat protein/putative Ig domain-containing protein
MKNQRTRITRFLIIVAMVLIGCYLGLTPGRTAGSANKATSLLPSLSGEAAIGHLKQTGLYNSLSAALTAARYQIEERKGGGYEASNPEQGYRTIFTPQGVEVRGASRTGQDWRLRMKLAAYGYGERKKAVTSAEVKAREDRIEYERQARDGGLLSEWYVNRASGLEQGFTIAQPPGKRSAGERLNLWLQLSGDLQAKLAESGQAIRLNGRGAGAGLRYEKLHSFDAMGRELEARMKLAGDEVKLEIADEGAIYPVTIDPTFTQQQKLEASDAAGGDNFGESVAISGETVVVGARLDDGTGGGEQGSAYVFVRSGTSWSQQQKLEAADAAAGDQFGRSVAISGETLVVGARLDDGAAGSDQGSAYVFVRSGGVWSQQQKLEASDPGAGDNFGESVGIDGETIVVGALQHNGAAGSNQGSAYVFVRSGGVWSQQQKLEAADAAADDQFGHRVAISGETLVVGARLDDGAAGSDQGSAYVFVSSGGVWSQQQKLETSDAAGGDLFGVSLAISGNTIVVGAQGDDGTAGDAQGSAYVFVRSGGVWSQQQKLEAADAAAFDLFGVSVAISGNTIVVGASLDDGTAGDAQGSAYVFARSGGVWSQQQKLEAADAAGGDNFGNSVAISGNTIVVGASLDDGTAGDAQGSAYVFASPNTPPTITAAVGVTRTAGSPASTSLIATVSDAEDEEQNLTVAVASANPSNGVTISGISVDVDGQVTASVVATCSASNASFTLRVTDSLGSFAEATLNITVNPNPAPSLGNYPSATVAAGGSTSVTPDSAPADNGSIISLTATAPGFTGTATVNPATGVVSISNPGPAGSFLFSVTATDNCGAQTTKTFTLTVIADNCGITINPATLPQPHLAVPYLRTLSATPAGNYTFSVSAGALPPGLQLVTALGVTAITGLPTTPGTFNFTIKARRNGTTCEGTRSYTVTIPATVVPILNCVQRNHNGTYTARFGYDNSTGAAVTIPVGSNNFFTPGNQNRGQTTVFQPGLVSNAFSVTFKASGNNLAVWFLRGPDGVLRPVNVLTTSIGCP